MAERAIGQAKTVLLAQEGKAIISTVIARAIDQVTASSLSFEGPAKFELSVQQHLTKVVLRQIDEILAALNLPGRSFTLSSRNIGAASASGIGISVSGFSIDVSAFLALLSCALEIPIRQDILSTGHIGSLDGLILPVDGTTAKCKAAQEDKEILQLVYPSLKPDASLKILRPAEFESIVSAIRSCRGKLETIEVANTLELVQKALEPEAIVLGSLKCRFYERKAVNTIERMNGGIAEFLTEENSKRFWDALESRTMSEHFDDAHRLVQSFAEYHIRNKSYPSEFGERISRLLVSIPPQQRKKTGFSRLLSKESFICLVQFATHNDYEDMSLLHEAFYGSKNRGHSNELVAAKSKRSSKGQNGVLGRILDQLDPDLVESRVTRPYDEARARYVMDSVRADTNEEFIESLIAFYTHIMHHTGGLKRPIDTAKLGAEALDVLKRTFPGKNGYNEALTEAKDCLHGGLRYIMDRIADNLKKEASEKYILHTFKTHIDPLDYEKKVEIIKELMDLLHEHLPDEITSEPAERFAEDYEEIIKAYIKSMNAFQFLLRRL